MSVRYFLQEFPLWSVLLVCFEPLFQIKEHEKMQELLKTQSTHKTEFKPSTHSIVWTKLPFPRKAQPYDLFLVFIPADLPTGNCPGPEVKAAQLVQEAPSPSSGLLLPKRWSPLSRESTTTPCDSRGKTFQTFSGILWHAFLFKNNSGSPVLLSPETAMVSEWCQIDLFLLPHTQMCPPHILI